MPVIMIDGCLAIVHLQLRPEEIPGLLKSHAQKYPRAPELEERGKKLIETNFPPDASREFVREVCLWGDGDRNVNRVVELNTASEIAQALREGLALALNEQMSQGVERIKRLRRLGQSFASKQLRFLTPERAVILDSVIRHKIGYRETTAGYDAFLADIAALHQYVCASTSICPEVRDGLRLCDIEAAIYAKLQGY